MSLEGALVPYGQPAGALSYIYGYGGSTPNELQTTTTPAPPSKQISFFGSTVNVAGGNGDKPAAVIDESGGGDLYGAQFVSGRQGSVDTLAGSQTFAILPSLGSRYAPRDPQVQRSDGGINVDGTPVISRSAIRSISTASTACQPATTHCCRGITRCCRAASR